MDLGSGASVAEDLGLQIVWRVDDAGSYTAQWEVPLDVATGEYDMVVTANHYTLASSAFRVVPSTGLVLSSGQQGGEVHVGYPAAAENVDVTARPASVNGGNFLGQSFSGAVITASAVPAGAVEDTFGNCNGAGFGEPGSVSTCPGGASGLHAHTVGASTGSGSVVKGLPNTAPVVRPGSSADVLAVLSGVVLGLARRRARRRPQR